MAAKLANSRSLALSVLCVFLLLGAGCKRQAAAPADQASSTQSPQPAQPDDQQLASEIQAKIAAEPALNGQPIHVDVQNQVATLSGTVLNDASRALAAAESGNVNGVKTVVNNLTVAPVKKAAKSAPEPRRQPARQAVRQAVEKRIAAPPPPVPPQPIQRQQEQVKMIPPVPPAPPVPVTRTVTLPAGTVVPVRITETLDSATTQAESTFHGSLATSLESDGMVAIPQGSTVTGRVVVAKDAAHFSGNSELSIELVSIQAPERKIAVATDQYTKMGKARGKNTAVKTGGGAALGAIIGALAGGGKGAAIGAIAGGGAGAGVNAVTRGEQVKISSESLVNFRLQSPITITTSTAAGASQSPSRRPFPQLQQP